MTLQLPRLRPRTEMSTCQWAQALPENGAIRLLRAETLPCTSTIPIAIERMRAVGVFSTSRNTCSCRKPFQKSQGPVASATTATTGSRGSMALEASHDPQLVGRVSQVQQSGQTQQRAETQADQAPGRHRQRARVERAI